MDCPTQDCPWPDEAHLDSCPCHPVRTAVLADMRAKVAELPTWICSDDDVDGVLFKDDVLDLIDQEMRDE